MIKRGIRQIRCNIFLSNFLINISYHIRELKFLIRGKRIFSQGKATFRKEEEALDGISEGVGISVDTELLSRGLIIRDRIIGRFP